MTDPSLRLNPMCRATCGSRAGCFSSVEWPPRRLAHRARRGADFSFWRPAAALRAEVRVCAPEVYWRLLTGGSWRRPRRMDGDWESHQLTALLQIPARNGEVLGRLERGFRLLGKPVARLRHWTRNTRAGAGEHRRPLRPRQRILCLLSG